MNFHFTVCYFHCDIFSSSPGCQSSKISSTAPSLSSELGNALRHQTDRDNKSEHERIMYNTVMLYYSCPLISS